MRFYLIPLWSLLLVASCSTPLPISIIESSIDLGEGNGTLTATIELASTDQEQSWWIFGIVTEAPSALDPEQDLASTSSYPLEFPHDGIEVPIAGTGHFPIAYNCVHTDTIGAFAVGLRIVAGDIAGGPEMASHELGIVDIHGTCKE